MSKVQVENVSSRRFKTFQSQRAKPPGKSPETFHQEKSVTAPGLAISPAAALKRYANGTLERKMENFYSAQSIEMPDVTRMSQLERLHLQAQYREDFQAAQKRAQEVNAKNEAAKAVYLQKQAAEKAKAPKAPPQTQADG